MSSSARATADIDACNLSLRRMGGAYRVDCERWWDFHGCIRSTRIGPLLVADVSVSPCVVRRDLGGGIEIADHYNLILQVEGSARMRQCGTEVALQPGDSTIIDSRYMSEFEAPQGFRQIAFAIPAAPVRQRFGRVPIPIATAVSGESGAGRLLADVMISCVRNASGLQGVDLTDAAVDVFAAATGTARVPGDAVERGLANRRTEVERFIDANIERHDLTPQLLARHFGISVRQLYRVTLEWDCTPGALIWSRRLARARQMLTAGRADSRILDVALSCGFKDGAHFSRAYRRAFGHSPRESRDQVPAGLHRTLAVFAQLPASRRENR
jgi:AraC-like DNA-binding protein